jgi:hypothetical protein
MRRVSGCSDVLVAVSCTASVCIRQSFSQP